MKKHNFSAGPSILPQAVIEQSAQGVLNINNSNLFYKNLFAELGIFLIEK